MYSIRILIAFLLIILSREASAQVIVLYKNNKVTMDDIRSSLPFDTVSTASFAQDAVSKALYIQLSSIVKLNEIDKKKQGNIVSQYVANEERKTRANLNPQKFREIMAPFFDIERGVKTYRKLLKTGNSKTQALADSWSEISPNTNISHNMFTTYVGKYGGSDEAIQLLESKIPHTINEGIDYSKKNWTKEGLVYTFDDELTSNVQLTESDIENANAIALKKPEILDLHSTASLLELKSSSIVEEYVMREIQKNAVFRSAEIKSHLIDWWNRREALYNTLFGN